jgi:hypothetical protein
MARAELQMTIRKVGVACAGLQMAMEKVERWLAVLQMPL